MGDTEEMSVWTIYPEADRKQLDYLIKGVEEKLGIYTAARHSTDTDDPQQRVRYGVRSTVR